MQQLASEYRQEMPRLHTTDQRMAWKRHRTLTAT